MDKDLKSQNVWSLTLIYIGTFSLVAAIHWGVEEVFEFSRQLGEQMLMVGLITTFGGVLSNSLPNSLKHALVYWRVRNVLAGHRCRRICSQDPRMKLVDLQQRWPELFLHEMEEKDQNAYWYDQIYKSVRNTPEVVQAHRSFLLYRDATTGLFILLVGTLLWHFIGEIVAKPPLSWWSTVVLLVVFVLVSQAARHSGNRMVANAVAVAVQV